jgi:hypothetical protein
MLYLISSPMHMVTGNYTCKLIPSDVAAELITSADSKGELQSLVHFASTVVALRQLTSLPILLVNRTEPPKPENGDCFIDIRVKPNVPKGTAIVLNDLEFWKIEFKLSDYQSLKESADWPAVLT